MTDRAHRAESDVTATVRIFQYRTFFARRRKFIFKIYDGQTIVPLESEHFPKNIPNDDSDTDASLLSNEEEEEEISGSDCVSVGSFDSDTLLESNILSQKFYDQLHDTTNTELVIPKWERNYTFDGVDAESKFDEWRNFRETRNGDNASPLGLKCSINSVNSVNKAWRQIFTNNILDMIVKYTNEYGDAKGDDKFEAITRNELLDSICILFIASIQKRKD